MPRRHLPLPTAPRSTALLGTLLAGFLLAAAAALAVPTSAAAAPRPGATGLHDGMMPADSPDAAPAGPVQPDPSQPNSPQPGSTQPGATPQAAGAQTGVDVSRWQHPDGASIGWSQVRASGQAFAIVKATEMYTDTATGGPVLYTNPYLFGDLNGARAAGLVVGAYAFAHPENSAIAQADAFANAIGGSLGLDGLPPVLDLEVNGGLSPDQLVSWTHTFLNRLQADTNTVPMIYSGPGFWNGSMGGNTSFTRFPLWEAHWTTAPAPYPMGGWSSYTLWQFTDTASIPGIVGAVDQSRSNGSPLRSIAHHPLPASRPVGSVLHAGDSLMSGNLQYRLDMQADGNLVEYGNGRALWATGTWGKSGAYLAVQTDGNLVLYGPGGRPLWATGTYGSGSRGHVAIQDDGNVVLTITGRPVWGDMAPGSDSLTAGATLRAGQYLHDRTWVHFLSMQGDGNLVLYRGNTALWATGTWTYPGSHTTLQADGNVVVYDNGGPARWATGTWGTGAGNVLLMQKDGNLVLYRGHKALWASGTWGR